MADHFYSQAVGDIGNRDIAKVTVGTSTAAGSKIELRITDGGVTRRQAYLFLEELADYFASGSSKDFIPSGQFSG